MVECLFQHIQSFLGYLVRLLWNNMLNLQYGLCSIRLQVSSDLMLEHLAEIAHSFASWVASPSCFSEYTLTIITPSLDDSQDSKYRAIAHAWAMARGMLRKTGLGGLDSWRSLYNFGIPINPKIFLFQDRYGSQNDFFCLNSGEIILPSYRPALWIIKAIEALGVHWHVAHGGAAFHASGVVRNGKGYLFLGQSGAGKSTVANLSQQVQGVTLHDDQILLSLENGNYLLTHPDSQLTPPLGAVFFLKQSQEDRLIALTPASTCVALSKSMLEYATGQDLYGTWVHQAFHNSALISRVVPGFDLYFRKSPDFWKLIDERFSD